MDPHDLLIVPLRRWRLLVACVLMAVAVGLVTLPAKTATKTAPVVFKATAVLGSAGGSNKNRNADFSPVIKSDAVIDAAVNRLKPGGPDAKSLAKTIAVKSDPTAGTIGISAAGPSAVPTADDANAVADAFLAYIAQQNLKAYQDQLTSAQHRVDGLKAQIAFITAAAKKPAAAAKTKPATKTPASPTQASTQAELVTLNTQYSDAFASLSALQLQGAPQPTLTKLDEAVAQVAPAKATPLFFASAKKTSTFTLPKSRKTWMALVVALGAIVGLVLAFLVDWLDRRVWTRADAERALGLPVVAEIPALGRTEAKQRRVTTAQQPRSAVASAYRALRAAVLMTPRPTPMLDPGPQPHPAPAPHPDAVARPDDPRPDDPRPAGRPVATLASRPTRGLNAGVVMVTSPANGEGRTSTAVNLAACMAEVGKTVVVVGLDFNNRDLADWLGVKRDPGLTAWLKDPHATSLEKLAQPSSIPNVTVVACGAGIANPTLHLDAIRALLRDAQHLADIVIVDTAPGLVTYDALDLAPDVDSVVLVVRAGKTRAATANQLLAQLAQIESPMLGVALIGTRPTVRLPGPRLLPRRRRRHPKPAVQLDPTRLHDLRGRSRNRAAAATQTQNPTPNTPADTTANTPNHNGNHPPTPTPTQPADQPADHNQPNPQHATATTQQTTHQPPQPTTNPPTPQTPPWLST